MYYYWDILFKVLSISKYQHILVTWWMWCYNHCPHPFNSISVYFSEWSLYKSKSITGKAISVGKRNIRWHTHLTPNETIHFTIALWKLCSLEVNVPSVTNENKMIFFNLIAGTNPSPNVESPLVLVAAEVVYHMLFLHGRLHVNWST